MSERATVPRDIGHPSSDRPQPPPRRDADLHLVRAGVIGGLSIVVLSILALTLITGSARQLAGAGALIGLALTGIVVTLGRRRPVVPAVGASAPTETERRFREVFDASPVGIALADERGLFVEVNPAWCALLGRSATELIGHSSSEFTHQEDLAQHGSMERRWVQAADPDGAVRVEKRWIRPDGELRWGWLSIAPVHGPNGENWTLAHAQDFTERKKVESVLQQSQATLTAVARVNRCVQSGEDPRPVLAAELRWLAQATSVTLLEPAGSGKLAVSHSLGNPITGAEVRIIDGAAGRIWLGGRAELASDPGRQNWGFGALPVPAGTRSVWWQPVSDEQGVIAVLALTFGRELTDPEDPAVVAVRTLAADAGSVLTAVRIRMELEVLADTDALTGLENRRGWGSRLQDLAPLSRQSGRPLTLALVDLDHFKLYNDAYGHHHGDLLLKNFAVRAAGMVRQVDVIARWGGEEFAIALPGCSAEDAGPLLDRLRTAVPDGQTCSIGYATLRPGESPADCLMRADAQLYQAKRQGRNRISGAVDAA